MRFTLLLISLSLVITGYSQVIKGTVTDRQSLEPIGGATIKSKKHSTISDNRGSFTLYADSAVIVISATGYKTDTVLPANEKSTIQVFLQPTSHALDEVVVSGTMRTVSRSESAIPVELFQAKYFKKNPTPNVFEALSTMNGVQPQLNCNICNTGDIHINGMEGPYTMVLIDGMPLVSSLSRIYGFSGIPTSIVKRMEIVKGPASTLYGSDAVAGLINIITKDALTADKFSADLSFTSLGEMNADLSTAFQTRKLSSLFGVNLFNYWTKSDINHDNFTDITQQRRLSMFGKWDFARANNLPFALSVRMMGENRWGGELQWNKSFRGSDSIYGESIVTKRLELTGVYGLTAHSKIDYSYSYHKQESYYGTTPFFANQHVGFVQVTGDITRGKQLLTWGLPMRFVAYDDNTFLTEKDNRNAISKQLIAAAFAQHEWTINSKLLLLSGLRYEFNNVHGSVISPRLALKYQPTGGHTFRLSGGNGYRIVNLFTEDHAALTGAREVVIASNLKPEKSWNINLNYTNQWMGSKAFYNLDASLFYTRFTNKILPDYDSDPAKIFYNNLDGYAISKGITVNGEMTIKKGPKLMTGITLMDVFAVEKDNAGIATKQRQMFAPVFSANYSISYGIRKLATTVDLTGKVYGPQRLPVVPNDFRPANSPWFNLLNIQFTRKFQQQYEAYLSVKNLLNFRPENPILHPDDPFDKPGGKYFDADNRPRPDTNPYGYRFDPSYSYAPMQGIKLMVGVRVNIN